MANFYFQRRVPVFDALKQAFRKWLCRQKIERGTVTLTQRRIFILPTRRGVGFGVLLLLMLVGDINYGLSLGYVLTFLLATMAVMSMLYAFRNLADLQVQAGHCEAVFAGEMAQFVFHFYNNSNLPRYQLTLKNRNNPDATPQLKNIPKKKFSFRKQVSSAKTNFANEVFFDLAARQNLTIKFPLPTSTRGWLSSGRLMLYTEFPLGLFHAWSYLQFDTPCLVYPHPAAPLPLPIQHDKDGLGLSQIKGDEDFSGVRDYVTGDALTHIAWKALAREQGLQVKQFSDQVDQQIWLDWHHLPHLVTEAKLAVLTRWVIIANEQKMRYGLRLPKIEIFPSHGDGHRAECLKALALFDLPQQSTSTA
ncbi:MAG: DUF58 domain-containing protein [Candidatus Nitrotoga sp.]